MLILVSTEDTKALTFTQNIYWVGVGSIARLKALHRQLILDDLQNTVTEFCPERKQVSPQYLVFFSFLTKLYNLSEFKRRSRRYNYFENSSCNLIGNSRNYSFLAMSAVSRRSDTVCQSYVWRRKFIKMNWNWITQSTYMTFLSSRLYFYAN